MRIYRQSANCGIFVGFALPNTFLGEPYMFPAKSWLLWTWKRQLVERGSCGATGEADIRHGVRCESCNTVHCFAKHPITVLRILINANHSLSIDYRLDRASWETSSIALFAFHGGRARPAGQERDSIWLAPDRTQRCRVRLSSWCCSALPIWRWSWNISWLIILKCRVNSYSSLLLQNSVYFANF